MLLRCQELVMQSVGQHWLSTLETQGLLPKAEEQKASRTGQRNNRPDCYIHPCKSKACVLAIILSITQLALRMREGANKGRWIKGNQEEQGEPFA